MDLEGVDPTASELLVKIDIPGQTGICHITHVIPGSTTFYMMNSLHGGLNTQELIKTLQNVTSRMEVLPESSRRVFGVEVDGQIFRAVRSKLDRRGYPFLWLLDMGDVLPFDERTMRLFQLPAYYQKFPPLAVRCELVDLVDEPFCGDFGRYLVENLYAARKFEVCDREELFLRVNLSSVPKGRKNGQVKPVRKPEPIPEYKVSEKTLTQEQLDILFEEPMGTSNAMKATMGFVPQDDKRICPFYDPNIEGCFKGAGCRLQHVSKDPDGWTRDQALHKCKIRAQLIEPRIGTVLEMVPTAVVNVEEFYAHLYLKEYTEGLNELQQLLNESANVRGYRRMDHKPYAREYVFARFKDDGRWYRAEVQDYFHDGLIQVQYLDYGNRDQVGIDELRLWEDRFDYLPFQAVHCRLANVSQVRENDFEATLVLSEAILDKKVAVKVLDIRSYWEVLVNLDSEMDVGRFLVHKGVARLRQPIVISDKDGLVPA